MSRSRTLLLQDASSRDGRAAHMFSLAGTSSAVCRDRLCLPFAHLTRVERERGQDLQGKDPIPTPHALHLGFLPPQGGLTPCHFRQGGRAPPRYQPALLRKVPVEQEIAGGGLSQETLEKFQFLAGKNGVNPIDVGKPALTRFLDQHGGLTKIQKVYFKNEHLPRPPPEPRRKLTGCSST